MERLRPSLAARREEAERGALEVHERLTTWEHEEAERRYDEERVARNAEVEEFRRGYEAGELEAVSCLVVLWKRHSRSGLQRRGISRP